MVSGKVFSIICSANFTTLFIAWGVRGVLELFSEIEMTTCDTLFIYLLLSLSIGPGLIAMGLLYSMDGDDYEK